MAGNPMFGNLRTQTPRRVGGSSGNAMFDNFISNILPLIEQMKGQDRSREISDEIRNRPIVKAEPLVPPMGALRNIGQSIREPRAPIEQEKPMDVKLGNYISPYQEASLALRNRALDTQTDLKERALTETERKGQVTTDVSQQRANVYEWKAKNPNKRIIANRGGNLIAVDPITGKSEEVKDARGQSISSGTLSESDKIELNQTNSLERIGETGNQTRQTMDMRFEKQGEQNDVQNTARLVEIAERNKNTGARDLLQNAQRMKEIEQRNADFNARAVKPPTETKQRVLNKVNEFKAREPELGKWVTLDEDGNIEVTAVASPGKYWGTNEGPTAEEREKIVNSLYNGTNAAPKTAPKTEEKPPNQLPPGAKPGGKWTKTQFGWSYKDS